MNENNDLATNQYLTFNLDDGHYAIGISEVREVLDFTHITKVPRTPDFMRGVINLRGTVVPVVDLRLQLGMTAGTKTVDTCIVIVEIDLEDATLVIGLLADSVQEVVDIDNASVEPPPTMGSHLNLEFIKGIGKQDDKFVIILEIDKILSRGDINSMQSAVSKDIAA